MCTLGYCARVPNVVSSVCAHLFVPEVARWGHLPVSIYTCLVFRSLSVLIDDYDVLV